MLHKEVNLKKLPWAMKSQLTFVLGCSGLQAWGSLGKAVGRYP